MHTVFRSQEENSVEHSPHTEDEKRNIGRLDQGVELVEVDPADQDGEEDEATLEQRDD